MITLRANRFGSYLSRTTSRSTAKRSSKWFPLAVLFVALNTASPNAEAGWILDQIGDMVDDARRWVQELTDNMRDGRNKITDIRSDINEAVDDLKDELVERRAGRDAWLGNNCDDSSDCALFRSQIIDLITNLGTLSNSLFIATELGPEGGTVIDVTPLTNPLQNVPGRALFPLYKAFSAEFDIFESPFVTRLSEAAASMAFLKDSIPTSACGALLLDRDDSADKISKVKVTALGLQLVGKLFKSIGTKEITKTGAIWGWAGIEVKNNRIKSIGIKFNSAGDVLKKYAGIASTKLLRCILVQDNIDILANFDTLNLDLSNLSNLDATVISRASQASVDNIQNTVNTIQSSVDTMSVGIGLNFSGIQDSVNTRASQDSVDGLATALGVLNAGLGGAVSTRASQESVDDLTENLADHDSLVLRVQVERILTINDRLISSYYLPETHGGLLEFVRDLVADTILRNSQAGFSVKSAEKSFEDGQAAQFDGYYKVAFDNYRKAYQSVVQ